MNLVIVDTPVEAKMVTEALDSNWQVEPCMGGVRDLPVDKLGIDILHDFQPTYTILPRKGNLVRRLMRAISKADALYIATPSGRLGEVMGWHVLALSPVLNQKPVYRIPLTSLTSEAIEASFAAPQILNMDWVEAEITQRIVDRLTAYLINPLTAKALNSTIPITRASIVCLQLLAEHEQALKSATPQKSWTLSARFTVDGCEFESRVHNQQGKLFLLNTEEQANTLVTLLKKAVVWVDKTGNRITERNAPAPYKLPTLIADAETQLGLAPIRVLGLVQTLYEAGWITYARDVENGTGSPNLASAQAYILDEYGQEYWMPAGANARSVERRWEIYPTDIRRIPENLPGDGAALYGLIWRRFVASCMTPAKYLQSGARFLAGTSKELPFPLEFRVQSLRQTFDGWLRSGLSEGQQENDDDLDVLKDGSLLELRELRVNEHVSETPEMVSPAALLLKLAGSGIKQLSVYAPALQILIDNHCVQFDGTKLSLTPQGLALSSFINTHFGSAFSLKATAQLEHDLDRVADGETSRLEVLGNFWMEFNQSLTKAVQVVLQNEPEQPASILENHRPVVLRPLAEG